MKDFEKYFDEVDDLRATLNSYIYGGYTEEQWKIKEKVDEDRIEYAIETYNHLTVEAFNTEFSKNDEELEDQLYKLDNALSEISDKIKRMIYNVKDRRKAEEFREQLSSIVFGG